jgi:hypothetical protein
MFSIDVSYINNNNSIELSINGLDDRYKKYIKWTTIDHDNTISPFLESETFTINSTDENVSKLKAIAIIDDPFFSVYYQRSIVISDYFQQFSLKTDDENNSQVIYEGEQAKDVQLHIDGFTDKNNIIYAIFYGDNDFFEINSTTGILSMKEKDYDYENPQDNNQDNIYGVTVMAISEEDYALSYIDYSVKIKNKMELGNTITTLDENKKFSHHILEESDEINVIGDINYSISGGADANLFYIANRNILYMNPQNYENPQDANKDNIYEVQIKLTSNEDSNNNATTDINVTILDVKEQRTLEIITEDDSIEENSEYSENIQLSQTSDPIGKVTYTKSGSDANKFTLSSDGVLSMSAKNYESPIDMNIDNIYTVTITATDEDGNSASKELNLTITDVTNSKFNISIDNQSVTEGKKYDSNISTTSISDDITFKITGDDSDKFYIWDSKLYMYAKSYDEPQDKDGKNTYEVTIQAADENENYGSDSFTINVEYDLEKSIKGKYYDQGSYYSKYKYKTMKVSSNRIWLKQNLGAYYSKEKIKSGYNSLKDNSDYYEPSLTLDDADYKTLLYGNLYIYGYSRSPSDSDRYLDKYSVVHSNNQALKYDLIDDDYVQGYLKNNVKPKDEYNPCPTNFRLPTVKELKNDYKELSLPYAGYKDKSHDIKQFNKVGFYMTNNDYYNIVRKNEFVYFNVYPDELYFTNKDYQIVNTSSHNLLGLSVRCVNTQSSKEQKITVNE